MTDREKAVVMAYTGICMLKGDKFAVFHRYAEMLMRRPLLTHELVDHAVEISEAAKEDFRKICADEPAGYWTYDPIRREIICPLCGYGAKLLGRETKHCPKCGERLEVLRSDKKGDEENVEN